MLKKIILMLAFIVLSMNAFAFSVEVGENYLYFNYGTGNNVTLTGGFRNSSSSTAIRNLIIPSSVTYGGTVYTVTSIASNAFYKDPSYGSSALISVTIPSTITSIGDRAFGNNVGLLIVHFNASNCTYAGSTYSNRAFVGCTNISSVDLGSSVTTVPSYLCYGLSGLSSITIPNSVTNIGDSAFCGCTGLTSVIMSNSLINISTSAFRGCTGLTSITLPSTVTNIGEGAFHSCTGLLSVAMPNALTNLGASAFYGCTGLTSLTMSNSLTNIGASAFYGCTGLTSVIMSNSLTNIGVSAFYGCTGLTSVTMPNSLTNIGASAFYGCTGLTSVTMPNSLTNIGASAFHGCTGLTSVTIPNGVDSIGSSAFHGCTGLTTVNFNADSCAYAGTIYSNRAFVGCTHITTMNFGNNVTMIPPLLCYEFSGLTSVALPNSLVSIGTLAFYGCTGLTSVTIPHLVTYIGDRAFASCSGIRLVNYNADSCLYMGPSASSYNAAFYSTNILTIYIGNNVKNIPAYAFYGCHISSITIPELVRSIGVQAFSGCTYLDTVNLYPMIPPSIGSNTFPSGVDCFNVRCDAYTGYYNSVQWLMYRSRLREYFYPNITAYVSSSNSAYGTASKVIHNGRYVSCDSLCVILATSNYGYHFDHWSNSRTVNPDTIHLIRDSVIVAYFVPNRYRVVGVPNHPDRGFVLGSDTVDYLDTVLLTAMANHGYMFDHWSDGAYENPHSVVANGNRTITAYFVPAQFSLSVISSDLNMGTVSGGGNYDYQSNRTIRAIANTGYHFTHWNDGDANNNRTITLTQDTSFTAYFAPSQYTLTLQSADESLGIVTGGGEYAYHDTVTISATATAPHYHFDRWSDNNTDNPRQYVITGNATLTAYFALDVHTVVVQVDDMAHGTVSGGGNYAYGSAATITAETPFSGWVFSHWSDGATYNPYTFAVLQDTVMTAYFVREGSQNGVDGVDTISAKIYVNNGQIVVEGAEGYPVYLYDVVGRLLATKRETAQEVLLDVPASGAYLVKIGDAPARRIVVRR